MIFAINRQAYNAFDLEISDQIDRCGIETTDEVTLSSQVAKIINAEGDGNQTSFCRATYRDTGRPIMLAIVPHRAADQVSKTALIFFVDIGWDDAIGRYISRAYDLSITEQEILEMFILGKSLDQIAEVRKRSMQTVRTQFYAALSKCGLSSQVDLVREVVAGSMFQSLVPQAANISKHPHRRELRMLRPGGRTLEVVMTGDFDGTPLFVLASFGTQKFAPDMESKINAGSICIYAISPPGYGHTSPHPEGTDRLDCLVGDVTFLMDQLNLQAVPFRALAASLLPTVRLAGRIPDRMTGIQSFATIPPARYQKKRGAGHPLNAISAMGNAALVSPTVKNLMTRSALRAWSILGTRKMAKLQCMSEPAVAPFLLEPETLQAIDEGFKSAILQGFERVGKDAEAVHSDWFADMAACAVPVTIVHGCKDKTNEISSIRAFANDFAEKVQLIAEEDAGSFMHITHVDQHIAHMVAFLRQNPPVPQVTAVENTVAKLP